MFVVVSQITRVAAGATHSLAVTAEGDLFAWGGNECGQLGFDSKGNSRKCVVPHTHQHSWLNHTRRVSQHERSSPFTLLFTSLVS